MALVTESWDDLKSTLDDVSIRCRDLRLTISCSKTKTLAVLPSDLYQKPVPIYLPNDNPRGSVQFSVPRQHCARQLWNSN